MDKLEEEIARLKEETAALKKKAEAKEVELRALIRAASLRPIPHTEEPQDDEPEGTPKRGGRQKGALSKFWRQVLQGIYDLEKPVEVSDVIRIASVLGNDDLTEGAARARLRHYADPEVGWLKSEGGLYTVTEKAIADFGLASEGRK